MAGRVQVWAASVAALGLLFVVVSVEAASLAAFGPPMTSRPAVPVEAVAVPAAAAGGVGLLAFFGQVVQYGLVRFLGLLGLTKAAYTVVPAPEVRGRILAALDTTPGLSLSELRRSVDCNLAAVVGQLETLQKDGRVHTILNAGRKRFFLAEFVDWARRDQVAALRNAASRAVLVALHRDGPVAASRLAEDAGVNADKARAVTQRLEAVGLVERQGDAWARAPPRAAARGGSD